ncbi:MAG: T9SS type A sorting domain-containing protein [Ignavibacteriaceae bacterium]|nr:T9SS type A sorting domain-containing protein [Ignavibacteriaceae bacterium]
MVNYRIVSVLLIIIFSMIVVYGFNGHWQRVVFCTELNGNGCVCHSFDRDYAVSTWVEGPDSLRTGESGIYKVYVAGGPAVTGGYNVAARFGTLDLVDNFSVLLSNELTQKLAVPFRHFEDTVFWSFSYTAPERAGYDTIYSVGLSTDGDRRPDITDLWNYGPKFPVLVYDDIVPVELASAMIHQSGYEIVINFSTVSELNNSGFEFSRYSVDEGLIDLGFLKGAGTKTGNSEYVFRDNPGKPGFYTYSIVQIDFDGTRKQISQQTIEYLLPEAFSLSQNFPNPFNPATKIVFSLENPGYTELTVYSLNGSSVIELIKGEMNQGIHEISFSGADLPSGVYLYSLDHAGKRITKKMVILK